jgi:hypothetical protein
MPNVIAGLRRTGGAELAITGTVQKVSNLILNMNIYVREASTGATIAAMSADMRGNTDVVTHAGLADEHPLGFPGGATDHADADLGFAAQ